jgi:hypothetical protein
MIRITYLSFNKLMEQSHKKIVATHGFDANRVFCPTDVSTWRKC